MSECLVGQLESEGRHFVLAITGPGGACEMKLPDQPPTAIPQRVELTFRSTVKHLQDLSVRAVWSLTNPVEERWLLFGIKPATKLSDSTDIQAELAKFIKESGVLDLNQPQTDTNLQRLFAFREQLESLVQIIVLPQVKRLLNDLTDKLIAEIFSGKDVTEAIQSIFFLFGLIVRRHPEEEIAAIWKKMTQLAGLLQ
ncbi:MAG: hypothetical protein WCT37_02440 [Patescibacteria group bacterium]